MKLSIEFSNSRELMQQLNDSVRNELEDLAILISENKNSWIVFSNNPLSDSIMSSSPSFVIKRQLDELPDLGEIPNLRKLDISFLGLNKLPKGIEDLINLETLDIGFNKLSLNDEIDKLTQLTSLKELSVFGLSFDSNDLEELGSRIPGISILFNREHFMGLIR